jgi:hypothetical protein
MTETVYTVRESADEPLAAAVVLRSAERAGRLSRAGLHVTARTLGGGA